MRDIRLLRTEFSTTTDRAPRIPAEPSFPDILKFDPMDIQLLDCR